MVKDVKTYNPRDSLSPVVLTRRERDIVVNVLKYTKINRLEDAIIAIDVRKRLEGLE